MQLLSVTKDEMYAVYADQQNDKYILVLAPNAEHVLYTWELYVFDSLEQTVSMAQHFVTCYGIAVDEGYHLEPFPRIGPHFTRNGENLLIQNALMPIDTPPEGFRAFVRAVNESGAPSVK